MSSEHPITTAPARKYSGAYAAHYTSRDLLAAIGAYNRVIELYPESIEAHYSRSQLENIVKLVVSPKELLDSQLALVKRHLERAEAQSDREADSPPPSE